VVVAAVTHALPAALTDAQATVPVVPAVRTPEEAATTQHQRAEDPLTAPAMAEAAEEATTLRPPEEAATTQHQRAEDPLTAPAVALPMAEAAVAEEVAVVAEVVTAEEARTE